MDEMSLNSDGKMTMTIGGQTFPIEGLEIDITKKNVKLDVTNDPPHRTLASDFLGKTTARGVKVPLDFDFSALERQVMQDFTFHSGKMLVEAMKPGDAQDFVGQDGRSFMLGSWVQGMYLDSSGAYRHGWGVLCAKPSKLAPCMSPDGTRSSVVYFLPEGQRGVAVMQLCDMWKIADERPEEKKFDFLKHFKFMENFGIGRGKFKDYLYGTPLLSPVGTIHDETIMELKFPDHPPRLTSDLWFADRNLSNLPADDNIVAAVAVDADGLPTHWHCEDCGEDNDFNVSPRRCGTCRRFRPCE